MRTVKDIPVYENIPMLVRAALNVPVANGKVANTFRLRKAVPTIDFLRKKNARVVLIGHIGEQGTETLQPVYEAMKEFVPGLAWCPVTIGETARAAVRAVPPGGVLMLENLRRDRGEVMNDKKFAQALAELADVFVEDSFDVCHRSHASVVGVPAFLPAYAGLLVEEEVRELTKALKPAHPALALIGGAKFSTKEPVLMKLLEVYDRVFAGGALGNDFVKAMGYTVGTSLVSDADPKEIKNVLSNRRLAIRLDAVAGTLGQKRSDTQIVRLDSVPADKAILDEGPATTEMLLKLVKEAKTILWNGPLGNYENGYTDSTFALAKAIAESGAHSVVGGGDTVAAIEDMGAASRFSFLSTGGGATLDFLAKGTLPGLAVLDK
ncbi:MAG: phosphoglycerate kinase [Candidatus Pacebacteria bacterium]|nr:phosphoglycerate kinase [Candidatus Paceibacterota bacterium]